MPHSGPRPRPQRRGTARAGQPPSVQVCLGQRGVQHDDHDDRLLSPADGFLPHRAAPGVIWCCRPASRIVHLGRSRPSPTRLQFDDLGHRRVGRRVPTVAFVCNVMTSTKSTGARIASSSSTTEPGSYVLTQRDGGQPRRLSPAPAARPVAGAPKPVSPQLRDAGQ